MSEVQTAAPAQASTDAGKAPTETAPPKETAASTAAPKEGQSSQPAPTAPPAKVVPEKYELKLPEGSQLGTSAIEKISAYAKQNGLSNKEAQSLLDEQSNAVKSFSEQQRTQHETLVENWRKEVEADTEIGGENFKQNVELASRVVKKFGDEQLIKDLNETGYGNYPPLVKLLHRIGKAMAPDQLVVPSGNPPPGQGKSRAERMYPNHSKGE